MTEEMTLMKTKLHRLRKKSNLLHYV